MQRDILEKHPDVPLRVYAIWFDMILTDSRLLWPKRLLDDPRVLHFWDEGKLLGQWYGEHPNYGAGDGVWWDTYLLYGPESVWTDEPSDLVNLGYTIYATREELRQSLAGTLAP